jgi:multimeric flavodoxin WrbA
MQVSRSMQNVLGQDRQEMAINSSWGKYLGLFISTGTLGGGQESLTLAQHGFIYVLIGPKSSTFGLLRNGKKSSAAHPGARELSAPAPGLKALEQKIVMEQGKAFSQAVVKGAPFITRVHSNQEGERLMTAGGVMTEDSMDVIGDSDLIIIT